MTPENPGARRGRLAAAAIPALAVLARSPALFGDWTGDDATNVTKCEAVRAWSGLLDIGLRPTSTQQYYPLTCATFWLEHKARGFHPLGFHAVNVLLHALNSLLLLAAFRRLEPAHRQARQPRRNIALTMWPATSGFSRRRRVE